MLAAHRFLDPATVLACSLGFLAFGLCASSVYLLNDLLDLTADRQHHTKHARPFAAGRLPLIQGMVASPLLTLSSLALAFWLSPVLRWRPRRSTSC